jgi:hypothetical protein
VHMETVWFSETFVSTYESTHRRNATEHIKAKAVHLYAMKTLGRREV